MALESRPSKSSTVPIKVKQILPDEGEEVLNAIREEVLNRCLSNEEGEEERDEGKGETRRNTAKHSETRRDTARHGRTICDSQKGEEQRSPTQGGEKTEPSPQGVQKTNQIAFTRPHPVVLITLFV